jgi:hypothetical protein
VQRTADGGEQPALTNSEPTSAWQRLRSNVKANWSWSHAQMAVVAAVWFALGLYIVLWVWGLRPIAFPAQDESVIRQAAMFVRRSGSPFMRLPFYDPEDIAHPRNWVTVGDYAIPAYSPFSYFVYGYLTRLRNLGFFLIAALPGASAAAFAFGVARLLPAGRRWFAIVAPVLGFPALYWLLRPWMNISPFLSALCWAFCFWAGWRASNRNRDLAWAFALLGVAGAIRPDFAFYVFSIPFVLTLAADPTQWRRIVIANLCAGAGAVAINLVLNAVLTGHPFQVAYMAAIAREHGEADAQQASKLVSLLFPMGFDVDAAGAWSYFKKYWLDMGSIVALVALQVTLLPWLYRGSWLTRALRLVALLLCTCLLYSRMGDVFGSTEPVGAVHHSVARYHTPLYLLAAVPPILFIGHLRRRLLFYPAALLLVALALDNGREIWSRQRGSITRLEWFNRKGERFLADLTASLPKNAMVYSERLDRWTWSGFTTGCIVGHEATLKSIQRALDAGIPTYVAEEFRTSKVRRLKRALERSHLQMVRVGGHRHLFEIKQ